MHESSTDAVEPAASSAEVQADPVIAQTRRYPLQFSGDAGEYFQIWIVNLALSILTLGIYSAWAKVRTSRYFYANTRLADSSFEYLADPIQILKGRLIAYTLVGALWGSAHFQVLAVYFPLLLLTLLLLPWVIFRTLAFRARYSAWRGLRFRFVGTAGDAYRAYLMRPLALPFTLYFVYPWVRMRQHDYIVTGHRFGGRQFQFKQDTDGYFAPFFIMLALGGLAYIAFIVMVVAVFASLPHPLPGQPRVPVSPNVLTGLLAVFYAVLLLVKTFMSTRYHNVMWQHTQLGPRRFECTLRSRDMVWLYFSNTLAIVLTLGMAVPWAMIRLARYRADHFVVVTHDNLDQFVAESAQAESATGAELLGALDMDFDIGL